MRTAKASISQLIIDQLAQGETRVLFLVVKIRKTLGTSAYIKGDLSSVVTIALRKLVAAKIVIENEGTFSLNPAAPIPPGAALSEPAPV